MHAPSTGGAAQRASLLHRAVWRWHFFAGLVILPFLAWLAITGGLYLYKPEIERAVYADWIAASPGEPLAPTRLIAQAERQTGARVLDLTSAPQGDSWRMTIDRSGERRTAFIDPATGRVLGTTAQGGVMETVKTLHSLSITGPVGNAMIEIVAGWAIVLVLTGFVLWWPRRATAAFRNNGARGKWRRVHAWTGATVGIVLLFLAASGLSWSVVWGAAMQTVIAKTESGRPRPPGVAPVDHHAPDRAAGKDDPALPWSMQRAAIPHAGHAKLIDADAALAIAQSRGLAAPYTLRPPSEPGRPWLISAAVTNASDAHVVYVDPQDGAVLLDARSKDFGAGARIFEWGLYTHTGQQYGEPNRLLMLAGAIGTLILCVTAPVLWWKRRGSRRLAPAPLAAPSTSRRVAMVMLVVGLALPLTGLTMLVALAGEWLLGRRQI
jgi:uncharacterized iron-regulated membrane protein